MSGLSGAAWAALAAIQVAAASPSAGSAEACGDYAVLRQMLAEKFGERPAQTQTAADGRKLELFASPRTDTWTAVDVAADGRACVIAVGRDWRGLLLALQGQPV